MASSKPSPAHQETVPFQEPYRPQFHFSPPHGWMNDPNGLVLYRNRWHMYYQYNPFDTVWGPMHWGHASSSDLINWKHHPIAISPYGKGTIFSGSAIVDHGNVTGTKKGAIAPLVAIYTLHDDTYEDGHQSQGISFSVDGQGLTFDNYENNPVLPYPGLHDIRDPSVFWYNNKYYVMSLAAGDRAKFYKSTDLKSWTFMSDFGVDPSQGDKNGVWECPSLTYFPDHKVWVLFISLNIPDIGSVTQYFVGDFDGEKFTNLGSPEVRWTDRGPDNYAAVPFNQDELVFDRAANEHDILIGWMSNWAYAPATPTSTWRGQYTVPRKMVMHKINGTYFLAQYPIDNLKTLRDRHKQYSSQKPIELKGSTQYELTSMVPFSSNLLDVVVELDLSNATGTVELKVGNDDGEHITLSLDMSKQEITFDRTKSGLVDWSPSFARTVSNPRVAEGSNYNIRFLLDTSSIEIFVDEGLVSFTSLVYPKKPYNKIWISTSFGAAEDRINIAKFSWNALNGIWK
ncbi:Levanase [Halotydeus destructor]|nr:Levanase [Halotydeus destructor]